jgi:hypothetical protein
MIFHPLVTSNSHVINGGQRGPLHLTQVRWCRSVTLKIKAFGRGGAI